MPFVNERDFIYSIMQLKHLPSSWHTSPGTARAVLLNQSLCICVGASNSALIVPNVECKWQQ